MDTKLAIIAIVVNDADELTIEKVNELLHQFREIIIGRMGIPYQKRGISLISVMLDGEEDRINSLSGKLGMIKSVSVKTAYANSKSC